MRIQRITIGETSTSRAAFTGAVGGLVGTAVMVAFMASWSRAALAMAQKPADKHEARRRLANAGVGKGQWPQGEPRSHHHERAESERAADKLGQIVTGSRLPTHTRRPLGTVFHFAFGAAAGMVYGALSTTRMRPLVQSGHGTLFGTAVWLMGDEIAMPLIGFGDPPQRTPLRRHAYVLAAHLAFGAGLHTAMRVMAVSPTNRASRTARHRAIT
ncbi:MAG TPA: DUF1440 domain-containing protein [Tepidisphaeraceae bacterium]|nr:DUF1440 domain-containing protein [Tepidisphaeraceae bacterium]